MTTTTHPHQPKPKSQLLQSTTSNLLSPITPTPKTTSLPTNLFIPFPFSRPPIQHSESTHPNPPPPSPEINRVSPESGFPATVRISTGRGRGGPAFVGQVFSMCDISGTGLMAVSTHFDIPFISKRTPEWMKKMFATITKSGNDGPVFRFFMDLGDAVGHVKRLNVPTGVVGACRLDLAYEHFKEKPHLFQFVPNDKQVKAANKLLKTVPQSDGRRVDGVPVFTAQNLDIAIATTDGVKWYTPYFFDKNMLDNILEESVDQHFHSLIQSRHVHRRRDVIDDNIAAEVVEDNGENVWEPPEVQEVLDEMGHPGIPFSVISKAAEMQLLYAVDKLVLGNRWLRKATGIQPKFPYMVDSFEKRSAASYQRASESSSRLVANFESQFDNTDPQLIDTSETNLEDNVDQVRRPDFRFPFGDWLSHPWLKRLQKPENLSGSRTEALSSKCIKQELQPSPFLPKITMVGISTSEGQMNKASLKKTMEDLTKELEQKNPENSMDNSTEFGFEDRDPLFVANVGDYYSGIAKTGSARWVRGGSN